MKIVLPPKISEEGIVCRLLLAEVQGPAFASYAAADALKCMQWMKVVVVNRLTRPEMFGAKGGKSLTDVIKAKGQFAGFGTYPDYNSDIVKRIQSALDIANSHTDRRSDSYKIYVNNALSVARNPTVTDPCPTGLYGWKTTNSAAPGGLFVFYQNLRGITFYTITSPK